MILGAASQKRWSGTFKGVHFEVSVSQRDGWTVVAVVGEIDLATAPQLRQRLVTLLSEGHHQLVLDLGATDFLDSIGLGVIVGALKRVQMAGGALVVATDVARIRSVFELTRLDAIIPVYRDVATALVGGVGSLDG